LSYYLLQNYLLKGQMAEINRSDTIKIVSCNKSERFFIIIVRCFGSFFKQCVSFVTERLLFMQRTKSSRLHSTCSVFALSDGAFLFKQSKVEMREARSKQGESPIAEYSLHYCSIFESRSVGTHAFDGELIKNYLDLSDCYSARYSIGSLPNCFLKQVEK